MTPRPPSPGSGASGAVKVTVSSGSATGETSSSTTVEAAAAGDGTWKALLPAQHAGTGHTITASSGSGTITLERVAFGDVWFCSGQSNMELGLHFTFSVNETVAAISSAKYANLRMLHFDHNPQPAAQYVSADSIVGASASTNSSWITPAAAIAQSDPGCHGPSCQSTFSTFSATCWYFGESLTDRMLASNEFSNGASAVPIGLIESAFGGTCIESWLAPRGLATALRAALGGRAAPPRYLRARRGQAELPHA